MRVVSVYAEDGELLSFEDVGLRTDALTTFRGDLLPEEIDGLCILPDEPLFARDTELHAIHAFSDGLQAVLRAKKGNLYFE